MAEERAIGVRFARCGARRRRAGEWLALALLALHFSSFEPSRQPIVTDVRISLYDAWRVTQGAVPHRDLYSVKTPLSTLLGAALHAAGERAGCDPLLAVRAGYLGLSALAGLLAFAAFRALSGGSQTAGLLAALAVCSFGLLGALPAIGNVAKHAAAVCVWGAGLSAWRGRWILAGALASLAFLDWQVNGSVALGLLVATRWDERGARAAVAKLAAGAVLGLAPLLGWLASQRALGAFGEQVLFGAWGRGAGALAQADAVPAWLRIARSVPEACPEQSALVWVALAGVALALRQLLRELRGRSPVPAATLRLRSALALPMAAVVLFSALDFQAYGDWLALLHALSFFLACAFCAAHAALRARWPRGAPVQAASALALLLALALARPGPLRPELEVRAAGTLPGLTLAEQRELAERAAQQIGARELAALDSAELLYLLRRVNPLPLAYWDSAAFAALGRPGESPERAVSRLLGQSGAGALIFPRGQEPLPELAAELHASELVSAEGRTRLRLYLR